MSLDLAPLNILIGANGAGKSNFISFFTLSTICRRIVRAIQRVAPYFHDFISSRKTRQAGRWMGNECPRRNA
ncbi:hypothetical protein [Massilia violaceinigra]|uniref:hypothetical protein n=1 Tax=Massilia violaceinigra TaxID=2045208 RepID=UPI001FB2F3FD|nr:hypothetical protein [Massilia violaceinigra]